LVDAGQRQGWLQRNGTEGVHGKSAREPVLTEGGEHHHAAWKRAHDLSEAEGVDHTCDGSRAPCQRTLVCMLETGQNWQVGSSLDLFSPATRDWFRGAFADPTPVQERGWSEVAAGRHVLMAAPTGSGKTLAAFLWCIDRLTAEATPPESERCRVLYVSPMKALAHD